MTALNYIKQLRRLDAMLRQGNTGNAQAIAQKLGCCRSTVFNYFGFLKGMGAEISYIKSMHTFKYVPEGFILKW
jgi:hypothetical protein